VRTFILEYRAGIDIYEFMEDSWKVAKIYYALKLDAFH
jgi:hypothetical protein